MKLAVSGKCGVGKTTLAALLAQVYADQGQDVPVKLLAGGCFQRLTQASAFMVDF